MINKKKLFDCYIYLLLLFPIATLFQTYFSYINILLVLVFLIIHFLFYVIHGIKRNEFLNIILCFALTVINFFFTIGEMELTNLFTYFIMFTLFFTFIISRKDDFISALDRNNYALKTGLSIWTIIVAISLVFPSSYSSAGWSGVYFGSFCKSIFRLGPTALFEMSVVAYIIKKNGNKNYLFFTLLPMFCFFMGGSRTYWVVGILTFLFVVYETVKYKKYFYWSLIPLFLIFTLFFFTSSMSDKFSFVSSAGYWDKLTTFTSGRTLFWEKDITSYLNAPLINQVFGNGYNFVYDVNYQYFYAKIWAHNDFIQILCTYGIVGLLLYLAIMFKLFRKFCIAKQGVVICFIIIMIWLVNASLNMFYTYFCSMISFPLLLASSNVKRSDLHD